MAITFGDNQYGKAEVRLVRINRDGDRHQIKDLNVSTSLRGDFADAHLAGDNAKVVATDTQKNTVYAFAQQYGVGEIEEFGAAPGQALRGRLRVGDRGSGADRGVRLGPDRGGRRRARARVLPGRGRHQDHRRHHRRPFGLGGVRADRPGRAQVDRVGVLGVPARPVHLAGRDHRPHPGHRGHRALALRFGFASSASADLDWAKSYADVRRILLESFAVKHSLALQQTLYYMGEQVLLAHPEVAEIRMSMPNKHHFLVDLSPFGLPNDNEVYYAADRPYGLIEGTVTRDDAPPAGRAWQAVPGF